MSGEKDRDLVPPPSKSGKMLCRCDIGQPKLRTLLALPTIEREGAGGMHLPSAVLHDRSAKFLTDRAKGNGVDAGTVGRFEADADV